MRLIIDLVMNHTSDQHAWCQAARADRNSPYRDYYVWSDTDDKYAPARIIFLDSEASNWTWDEQAGQFFWHRFYSSQPDLNFDNPAVREEMFAAARFWLDMGVDGFRADAVPYLYEREGTNCENLPETHVYLKEMRLLIDEHYPDRILLFEANQWPEDVLPYFGAVGEEFQMGFHFPIMTRIFMALRSGDRTALEEILERTPRIPANCQWCIFLRNHDELTLEMVTEEERQWMWAEYAPEARMRLNLGIRRRLAPLLDNDRRKIELANSILFSLPGSPILYYGDEIGMGDNIWLPDRNGVRTPMQWSAAVNAGFSNAESQELYAPVIMDAEFGATRVNVADSRADETSLFHSLQYMIAVRKQHAAFGRGDFRWAECDSTAVAAYIRSENAESILVVNNLSGEEIVVRMRVADNFTGAHDILSSAEILPIASGKLDLQLQPFGYHWLKLVSRDSPV